MDIDDGRPGGLRRARRRSQSRRAINRDRSGDEQGRQDDSYKPFHLGLDNDTGIQRRAQPVRCNSGLASTPRAIDPLDAIFGDRRREVTDVREEVVI